VSGTNSTKYQGQPTLLRPFREFGSGCWASVKNSLVG